MTLYNLRTNHMTEPLGIDGAPEFSWKIESSEKDVLQTAYQIDVFCGDVCVFSTGKVQSDRQSFVSYEGELQSKTEYRWEVTVWDNHGNEAKAESKFETAFLTPEEFDASWIESTIERNPERLFTYGIENPVVLFEKNFRLSSPVKKARLYATAYGCYRVLLNGVRPDDREFAPDFTPYGKILNYQTYDVTELLNSDNNLEFFVGNGWFFCAQTAVPTPVEHKAPAVLFFLDVTCENGEEITVASDGTETVRVTNILFSDLFSGERIDLTAPYGDRRPVAVMDYDKSVLRAQPMPGIRAIEEFPAVEVFTSPKGETIVDFGQTLAGRARVNIDVPKGTEVKLEYTEILDRDRNYFATMKLRQCDTVVSNGEPILHEAMFTFHGFRYIRVTGMNNAKPGDFTAVLLSTEKENHGEFTCSDKRLERLYKNIRYSQKNNMMSIPTDCPSREKAGWTGDILIYGETASINEEMTPFLKSWLAGLMADQYDTGVIPLISPFTNLYQKVALGRMKEFGDTQVEGTAGWSDAIVWVPYFQYRTTGDISVLHNCFDAMKKHCDYVIKTAEEKRGSDLPYEIDRYLWNTGFQFGEWLVPGRAHEGFEVCKETSGYTTPFYGFRSMELFAEICRILGVDDTYYADMAAKMKNAIIEGIIRQDRLPDFVMGGYVLAFAFDLVPDDLKTEYASRLVKFVEDRDGTLGTGFLATVFMLPVLDKIGWHDLALQVLLNEKAPSWLFEVKHGATTMWENWHALDDDDNPLQTSFDHYAFGCVDSYLFHNVCGIDGDAGYRNIVIRPMTDDCFKEFSRTFISEAGEITVTRNGSELTVKIPCNTKARVYWNGAEHEIGSGTYTWR